MNGYVSKPINFEKFNNELKRVLKFNKEKKAEHQRMTAQFNHNIFMQSIADDNSTALELIRIFIDKIYPESIDKIKSAIDNKDGEMLKEISHYFKGSVGYFSKRGYQLAFKLEKMGREQNFVSANEVYEELKNELDSLIPVLRDFAKKIEY